MLKTFYNKNCLTERHQIGNLCRRPYGNQLCEVILFFFANGLGGDDF